MNFGDKIPVINADIFASSSVRSVSRTDHGADDEGDAAVEVDGALQLVVLVHAGRHLPSALSLPRPESQPLYDRCACTNRPNERSAAPEKLETCMLSLFADDFEIFGASASAPRKLDRVALIVLIP